MFILFYFFAKKIGSLVFFSFFIFTMTNSNDNIWKDLISWQTEINKKDSALIKSKPVHDKVRVLLFMINKRKLT